MVKLALWMPLLSLAAFAVTSPVQSSPDGRDLRSPDSQDENLSEKKERVKSAISEGIMFVSDLTIKAIDSFPQELTDFVYTILDDLNVAVNQHDIDNSDHANETADSGIRDLKSPDSRPESSPYKKAIIKSTASYYIGVVHNQIKWEIDQLSEKPFNFFYGLLSALDFSRLKDFPQGLPLFINGIKEYVFEFFEIEKTPTERDSAQTPAFETFNSATELIKQMIASNFGIDLTQAFHEAIPEGVMEKSFADSNDNNDTREVEFTATEAHSSSLVEECAPGHKLHDSCASEGRRCLGWDTRGRQLLLLASKHTCALKIRKNSPVYKIKLQWFVDIPPNSADPLAERLTRPPSPNQNKDASHTYVHMHRARDADLFEDFCKDRLPDDEVYVPPQHQPINPEDEDDVVPDQHAAFGITKATQRQKEAAWKDLGLSGLMNRGPPIVKGKGAAGGSRMPR
ncbi:Anaphase-promoting complex subunit 13 [Colletotrichum fructicola]|nr:Anaphase-promoting complex subunit 13 [Colletotrichum fructicola]KAF4935099.1 Anaphase-promoting complex subunit 13 [Colletotrichum fructicola]